MAVAAYSSLLSLTHVLDNLHYRAPFHFPALDLKQIETLQENVDCLVEFSELHSDREGPEMKVLWRKMAEVAFEAEDMIDFHVVNQLHIRDHGEIPHKFAVYKDLHQVSQLSIRSEGETSATVEAAEDMMIDSGVVNQIQTAGSQRVKSDTDESGDDTTGSLVSVTGLIAFIEDMKRVNSKIEVIKEDLLSMIEEEGDPEDVHQAGNQPTVPVASSSSTAASPSAENVIVGIDEHVVNIMEKLTGHQRKLQILPIVGMGGLGKTTLARSVFDHQLIVYHFDVKIWLTVSQEYNLEHILKDLFDGAGNEGKCENLAELADRSYKSLFGRRYLIVVDDVWTTKAWDDLKRCFPDNENGSRVMLTTRLLEVATCLGSLNPFSLTFLDEFKSWELFCQVTFGQKGCPYVELEKIGKAIARSCRGLPLEISVIGRLLANSNKTLQHWRSVAENISSFANAQDNEHCLKVLSLSYRSLPMHLKPCFLYMRVFREDESILVSDLIDRWMAEGFVKLASDKTLEETANHYLKDLIDRNLIFYERAKNLERLVMHVRKCGTHDLLRDLCLRESGNENFIESPRAQNFRRHYSKDACLYCSKLMEHKESIDISKHVLFFPSKTFGKSTSCHFACDACRRKYSHIPRSKLVRAMAGSMGLVVKDVDLPTESRYLEIQGIQTPFFQDLHMLWNLQTLIIFDGSEILTNVPSKIWEMPQLRRIRIMTGGYFLHPVATTNNEGGNFVVLKNLQRISNLVNFEWTTEVLNRVPNLKHVRISFITYGVLMIGFRIRSHYSLGNLAQLQKLESLYIENASENISYPNSLKKLTLLNCQMVWKDVSTIGSLPNLEELELHHGIEGAEWNPEEGEFLRLKKLRIHSTDLVRWVADSIHFPVLEELQLWYLKSLEEIPCGIGDIPTLHSIKLVGSKESLIKSVVQIWEEQQDMGNETFYFEVNWSPYKTDAFKSLRIKDGNVSNE